MRCHLHHPETPEDMRQFNKVFVLLSSKNGVMIPVVLCLSALCNLEAATTALERPPRLMDCVA